MTSTLNSGNFPTQLISLFIMHMSIHIDSWHNSLTINPFTEGSKINTGGKIVPIPNARENPRS